MTDTERAIMLRLCELLQAAGNPGVTVTEYWRRQRDEVIAEARATAKGEA